MDNLKKSLTKNKTGILLMIISSICACVGQLFWKLSGSSINFYLLFGFLFYGIGALIMLIAYQFGSLSVLQPILSLNYVLSIILGITVLNESVSFFRIVGIFVIIIGIVLIGGGDD